MTYREEFQEAPEFWSAVVRAGIDGFPSADRRLEFSAATGLGATFPSEGGFLIQQEWASDLWNAVYSTGQALGRCTRQPISNLRGLKIPAIDENSRATGSRYGGVQSYWSNEADTVTATRPKYREISLVPNKLLALSYVTGELLADARALAAWLERTFVAEAVDQVESEIFAGSGSGRPLGILNSSATIEVPKESGQSSSTVVPANLLNMAGRLWSASHQNAAWYMNNDAFIQIADTSFSNGAATVVYGSNGQRLILGLPLFLSEHTAALGLAGDVVLADLSQYLIGEESPDFVSSIHVRFLYDEGVFRFRRRIDGAPAWSSPVTPKNSATTQSPFISLAARA